MQWLERWRRPSVSLLRIAYVSMVSPRTSPADVEALVAKAMVKNREQGISGILVFNGQNFMQIIEGPPDTMRQLIDRLRTDPRHYNIGIQFNERVTERCFGGWELQLIVPFNRQVPAMPTSLEPPLQRLWGAFCSLG